jgi:hypothetical protein
MSGISEPGSGPIVIYQNTREECRLSPGEGKGRKYVDLRSYCRDQKSGKACSTEQRITIDLGLWPQFLDAVSSPETWTKFLPFGGRQLKRTLTRGRLIFPEDALHKFHQEQIFLEAQNFQGIPFIFLKTLARTTKGGRLSPANIGPLLWSQVITGLRKMEEALIDLGWLTGKADRGKSQVKSLARREESRQWQAG